MRAVAKFQFRTAKAVPEAFEQVSAIVEEWAGNKFELRDDGSTVIRVSGKDALFDRAFTELEDECLATFNMLEPVQGGQLQTELSLLKLNEFTAFRCVLRLGSDTGLARPGARIHSPRFIKNIINAELPWRIGKGGERVFAHPFDVSSEEIETLENLISSDQRRLPLLLVSELNGKTLAGDLHDRLATDLCGLAHVVRINEAASWDLTKRVGKEWSCYNGAVRLYWPFRYNRENYRSHPLWTYDRLLRRSDNEDTAKDRLRDVVSRVLLEASTFSVDDPAFADFEAKKVKLAGEQLREVASADGDFKALAEAYASENDKLQELVKSHRESIQTLEENLESLTIALRSRPDPRLERTADEEAPPQTISEAVQSASSRFKGLIEIARETEDAIEQLNPSAGPPDKVLRYLQTLADLADELKSGGSIGNSVPVWLKEHGVECSGDSETAKNMRQPQPVNGELVDCEFHAKPANAVSPDMCVRIHFGVKQEGAPIRIAYIGRHQ